MNFKNLTILDPSHTMKKVKFLKVKSLMFSKYKAGLFRDSISVPVPSSVIAPSRSFGRIAPGVTVLVMRIVFPSRALSVSMCLVYAIN